MDIIERLHAWVRAISRVGQNHVNQIDTYLK